MSVGAKRYEPAVPRARREELREEDVRSVRDVNAEEARRAQSTLLARMRRIAAA